MKSNCHICNRELEVKSDPLSIDCGGDCWGCIGEIEAGEGYEPSLMQVKKEFFDGFRKDWMPSPETSYEVESESRIRIRVKLNRPLGDPWINERFILRVVSKTSKVNEEIFEETTLYTNEIGECIYVLENVMPINSSDFWYLIVRNENEWSYQITGRKKA